MKNKENNKNKKSGMSGGSMVAVGAGVAALGAGAYYLMGPKGKAHQKKVSALAAKMKKEVTSQAKKMKEISMPVYHKTVDMIAENYAKQYKMHEGDIQAFAKKLKSEWKASAKKVTKKVVSKSKRG